MARLTPDNEVIAHEIIGRYPVAKSALIPLLHLAQSQDGYVTEDAMAHIAELVDVTPAEVLGTCTFYEMFKLQPVGRYLVNICTNISCHLEGADKLIQHAEKRLGIKLGGTTPDGSITLEGAECIAACTEAPCLQVNYRYQYQMTNDRFDRLVDDLRQGLVPESEIPPHGVLAQVRQRIPDERRVGPADPTVSMRPPWFPAPDATDAQTGGGA